MFYVLQLITLQISGIQI